MVKQVFSVGSKLQTVRDIDSSELTHALNDLTPSREAVEECK